MTPLILAGPPLILAMGDVGVLGAGFVRVGDLGAGFVVICLVGGALTGRAVSVVRRVVVGGGPGLLDFIFSTIVAALISSFGLEGDL